MNTQPAPAPFAFDPTCPAIAALALAWDRTPEAERFTTVLVARAARVLDWAEAVAERRAALADVPAEVREELIWTTDYVGRRSLFRIVDGWVRRLQENLVAAGVTDLSAAAAVAEAIGEDLDDAPACALTAEHHRGAVGIVTEILEDLDA